MPSTNPELVEYGFGIFPGTETFMPMYAEVIHSTHEIINIHSDIRNCLMEEESKLRYFQHYAYLNCLMECTSNYTFKVPKYQHCIITMILKLNSIPGMFHCISVHTCSTNCQFGLQCQQCFDQVLIC